MRLTFLLLLLGLAGCALPTASLLSDNETRRQAALNRVTAMSLTARENTAKELTKALGDPGYDRRRRAAEALARLGPLSRGALPSLSRCLKDPDGGVRLAAADALAALGPEALNGLLVGMRSDDAALRERIVTLLSSAGLGWPDTLPAVVTAFKDLRPETRLAAIRIVRRMGPAASPAAQPLRQALSDTDTTVRLEAVEAFGAMGAEAGVEPLCIALGDPALSVRRRALALLASSNPPPRAQTKLFLSPLWEADADMRVLAITALSRLTPLEPMILYSLVRALSDPAEDVRQGIAALLTEAGAAAVPELKKALVGEDRAARRRAADILEKIGTFEAREAVRYYQKEIGGF